MATYTMSAAAMVQAEQTFQTNADAMVQEIEQLGATLIRALSEYRDEGADAFAVKQKNWETEGTTISNKVHVAIQAIENSRQAYVRASQTAASVYGG